MYRIRRLCTEAKTKRRKVPLFDPVVKGCRKWSSFPFDDVAGLSTSLLIEFDGNRDRK